jgi:Flp pilus assembly protein protease CpaA
MDSASHQEGLTPSLRFLKWLVIILTLTMIIGVITVVAVLVTRMQQGFDATPAVPAALSLPEGSKPRAVTMGKGWIAVVTDQDRILIFNADGSLRQEVLLTAPQ